MRPPDLTPPQAQQPQIAAAHPPSLARSATWQLAATVARVAIGLVAVPLYTRLLGMSQWGLLALFQAAIAPLVLLDGLNAALIKYVAEHVARGDEAAARRVVHTTFLFNAAVGVAGLLALVASSRWLATSLFVIPAADVEKAVVGFRLIAVNWVVGVVTATSVAVIAAHQQYGMLARLGTLSGLLSAGAGVAAAAGGAGIIGVLLAQTGIAVASCVVHCRAAARLLPGLAARPRVERGALYRSLSFGGWQAVATAGMLLVGWSDRYVLGAFFVPAVVGYYAVVSLLFGQLQGAFTEIGDVLFPAVSRLEARGELAAARHLSLLAGWTLTTAFGTAAVALAVVGGDFLHIWISEDAARAALGTLRLLCIGGIAATAVNAPFNYVLGVGNVRWDALSTAASGLTVVAVGIALVPRLGLEGVGYGVIAAALLRWAVVYLVWRRYFSVDHSLAAFATHVWVPPVIAVALLGGLVAIHEHVAPVPSWAGVLIEICLVLAAAVLVQLGVNELLPGGARRRRDVVASFRPVLSGALARWRP